MPITTTSADGSGTSTFTNAGTGAIETDVILTTPATADFIYVVKVEWICGNGFKCLNDDGVLATQGVTRYKVGPSTNVRLMSYGPSGVTGTVTYSYSYLGIKVT